MRQTRQIWQALIQRFRRPATTRAAGPQPETTPAPDDTAALQEDVAGLKSGLEQLRQRDEQQLQALQRRVDQLESERDVAREQAGVLRNTLTAALSRQEKIEIHTNTLEIRLREQGEKYQAALQEALIRERRQNRRLNLAITVAILAFVLGITGGVISFRALENNARLLAGINQGIRDIQAAIEQQPARWLQEPAATPDGTAPPAAAPGQAPAVAAEVPPPVLPAPDFVASRSLPLSGHAFNNRRDVRAFFRENARQPGVVALPSGLQYRVLLPGAGRIPGPSDTVVIEYRAFRPDGTELDNSFRETQPSTFVVSEASPGLEEALQHMQEGAQWELYVPPALASDGVRKRGRFGFEPLIFTVELLSVESVRTPPGNHSLPE